jgi:hypothetical protein
MCGYLSTLNPFCKRDVSWRRRNDRCNVRKEGTEELPDNVTNVLVAKMSLRVCCEGCVHRGDCWGTIVVDRCEVQESCERG